MRLWKVILTIEYKDNSRRTLSYIVMDIVPLRALEKVFLECSSFFKVCKGDLVDIRILKHDSDLLLYDRH